MKPIRIALSGGGHRATMFSLGALLYLVDSGRNRDVRTITSVSGGSVTNAYLSLLMTPFNKLTASEFREHAGRFAQQIAGSPAMLMLAVALYPLVWGIWLVPIPHLDHACTAFWIHLVAFVGLGFMWAFAVGCKSGGTLLGWWGTWFYVGFLLIPGIVLILLSWKFLDWYWCILLVALVLFLLSRRHLVAGMAFGTTIRCPGADANTRLEDSPPTGVRHIFCATELHVGRHMFFSRDFVYCEGFGVGVPGAFRLCDAVQVSANFPGGFPFRRLRAKTFHFVRPPKYKLPKCMVMTDGGVYDNTATAWYREPDILFRMRLQQKFNNYARQVSNESILATHPDTLQSVLEELEDRAYDLVAVNAAYPPVWHGAALAALPVLSDLTVFTKCTETLYNNDNQQRLREMRRLFINQQIEGALISVEEHPEALASYLSEPKRWFSGTLPEKKNRLLRYFYDAGMLDENPPEKRNDAALRYELSQEILSFYAQLEYSPSNSIPSEIIGRARDAIELLHPGYQDNKEPSPEELDELEKLLDEMVGLQEELNHKERTQAGIQERLAEAQDQVEVADLKLMLAQEDVEVPKAVNPLTKAKEKVKTFVRTVNIRIFKATAKILPLKLELSLIRFQNQKVATTLRPLGVETTAKLLYQGYLCAMMNLHVLLSGYPLMSVPKLQDFRDLVSNKRGAEIPSPYSGRSSATPSSGG